MPINLYPLPILNLCATRISEYITINLLITSFQTGISPGACLSGLRNFDEQAAQNFVPRYFDDIPVDPTIVQDCGGEESCVYDTWATNSTFYGQRTREYTEAYFQLKKEMSKH